MQRSGSFTTLSNAAYIKVQLRTQMTSGWITFDDITLQNGAEQVYDYSGGARVAVRQDGALLWLLGDYRGSTKAWFVRPITANSGRMRPGELRFKAWSMVGVPNGRRYSVPQNLTWCYTLGCPTDHHSQEPSQISKRRGL